MSQGASPFKFLDSYQEQDRDIFFGRDKDVANLYNALSGVKNLLLYGPSGSGKTSLIECGLRNQFSDADWFALTIRRGANLNASVFEAINEALAETISTDAVSGIPLDPDVNFGQAVEALFSERYQPIYLLFDQFEELLIMGSDAEKKEFFTRINQLIRYKVPCRVILIMREEFIGHLSEFEALCPSLFQNRFRLEKMGRTNVREVITNILTAERYHTAFDTVQPNKLCEDILSKLPDVRHEIELAHVQVFLGELWERAAAVAGAGKPMLQPGLIQESDNLESVLDVFLKKQFAELEPVYGEKAPLEVLAAMITERNTKLQMSEAGLEADLGGKSVNLKAPLPQLLQELEKRRIIRALKTGNETTYEISHDILAQLVGQNLTREMKLRERAQEIYNVYAERSGYFSEDDLNYLRPFQAYRAYPAELKQRMEQSEAHIQAARDQELRKTRKRLRGVVAMLGLALVALVAAAFFWFSAARQQRIAQSNFLMLEARTVEQTDPTVALRLAEAALALHDDSAAQQEAHRIYRENMFYRIFSAVQDETYSMAVSAKGSYIANGSVKGRLRVWDKQGKLIWERLDPASGWISCIAFSPDEEFIAVGLSDNTVRVWHIDGTPKSFLLGHDEPVGAVTFSPDSRQLVTGSSDRTFRLWNLDGKLQKSFEDKSDISASISAVAFSHDGAKILAGDIAGLVMILDTAGRELHNFNVGAVVRVSGELMGVTSAVFSPDDKFILTGSQDSTAALWTAEGQLIQRLAGHSGAVLSAAFTPDGYSVLTSSEDGTAKFWSTNGTLLYTLRGHTNGVTKVCSSPDGATAITCSLDGTTRLWTLKGNYIKEFFGHHSGIHSVAVLRDGATVAAASQDTLLFWRSNGRVVKRFHMPGSYATFSPRGDRVIVGDGFTTLLNDLQGNNIMEFKGDNITTVAFSPGGDSIALGHPDGNVSLLRANGRRLHVLKGQEHEIRTISFAPDGQSLLTGSADTTAILWTTRGKEKLRIPHSAVSVVSFSTDGKLFLTGSADGLLHLWRLSDAKCIVTAQQRSEISFAAFLPDSKSVIFDGGDNLVRLINTDGNCYQIFRDKESIVGFSDVGEVIQPNSINSVAVSPDGRTILTGSNDTVARLWPIPKTLRQFLDAGLMEPLSESQKKKYRIK